MAGLRLSALLTVLLSLSPHTLGQTPPRHCADLWAWGFRASGSYPVGHNGSFSHNGTVSSLDSFTVSSPGPFRVSCDMSTAGGGWTVVQRRQDGSVPFNRTWGEYAGGFGNIEGEFWIGLDRLHSLTAQEEHELYVYLEDWEGNGRFAKYGRFSVGDANSRYTAHVSGYSGDATDSMTSMDSDGRFNIDGVKFTTRDQDNDDNINNCAAAWGQGGWWHGAGCGWAMLNGRYLTGCNPQCESAQGIVWNSWKTFRYSLKKTVMMIRPASFSRCPIADYVRFKGACYKSFAERKTHGEAKARCAADGGKLAMPKDAETNTLISRLGVGQRWIGLTDRDTEGRWVFEDGTTLESTGYTRWGPGEPNHLDSEDCAVYTASEPTWTDVDCSSSREGFICQIHQAPCTVTRTHWNNDDWYNYKFDLEGVIARPVPQLVVFEVRVGFRAHIGLSADNVVPQSHLRLGVQYNSKSTLHPQWQSVDTPGILSADEFRRFWICWSRRDRLYLAAGRGGEEEPFVTTTDTALSADINYVGYGTYDPHGQFRFNCTLDSAVCSEPPTLNNTAESGPDCACPYWPGEICRYECITGYHAADGDVIRTCGTDGLWTGTGQCHADTTTARPSSTINEPTTTTPKATTVRDTTGATRTPKATTGSPTTGATTTPKATTAKATTKAVTTPKATTARATTAATTTPDATTARATTEATTTPKTTTARATTAKTISKATTATQATSVNTPIEPITTAKPPPATATGPTTTAMAATAPTTTTTLPAEVEVERKEVVKKVFEDLTAFKSALAQEDNATQEEWHSWRSGERMPEGYDKNTSPQTGETLEVTSSVAILHVGPLSEENANLSVTVEYTMAWLDARLRRLTAHWTPVPSDLTWAPPLAFGANVRRAADVRRRGKGREKTNREEISMWLHSSGVLAHRLTRTLYLTCVPDMGKYPLDQQECSFRLHGYSGLYFPLHPPEDAGSPGPVRTDMTAVVSQFKLTGLEVQSYIQRAQAAEPDCTLLTAECEYTADHCTAMRGCIMGRECDVCKSYSGSCQYNRGVCKNSTSPGLGAVSALHIRLQFSRRLQGHVIQTFLPTASAVMTSWLAFWFHPGEVVGRVTLGVNTLLSLVVKSSSDRNPETHLVRAYDVWMLGCVTMVMMTLLETVVVNYVCSGRKLTVFRTSAEVGPAPRRSTAWVEEDGNDMNTAEQLATYTAEKTAAETAEGTARAEVGPALRLSTAWAGEDGDGKNTAEQTATYTAEGTAADTAEGTAANTTEGTASETAEQTAIAIAGETATDTAEETARAEVGPAPRLSTAWVGEEEGEVNTAEPAAIRTDVFARVIFPAMFVAFLIGYFTYYA